MKTSKILVVIAVLITGIVFTSCTKDPGVSGKASVKGVVSNLDGNVNGALVYITYGATEKTDEYDNTTVTLEDGSYSFEGLTKGDYYIEASFLSDQGYKFISTGYMITIGSKKSEVIVDIELE